MRPGPGKRRDARLDRERRSRHHTDGTENTEVCMSPGRLPDEESTLVGPTIQVHGNSVTLMLIRTSQPLTLAGISGSGTQPGNMQAVHGIAAKVHGSNALHVRPLSLASSILPQRRPRPRPQRRRRRPKPRFTNCVEFREGCASCHTIVLLFGERGEPTCDLVATSRHITRTYLLVRLVTVRPLSTPTVHRHHPARRPSCRPGSSEEGGS